MPLSKGSRTTGTRLVAPAACLALLCAGQIASADAVKTVNGAKIDSAVFDYYVQSRTQRGVDQLTEEERTVLLDELTDLYLLSTQQAASGIRNEPEVQAQIELQIRGLIAQTVATRYLEGLEITDEEISAEYAEQAALAPPLQYKARHILVESQGAAIAIIEELDGGSDFVALATEKSTGPSGPNGGDLGWFSPNQMVAPFSEAVAALEDGAYTSEPVQTDFGWHVILREDSRESEAPPLDSVRETVVQALRQKKFQSYLEEIRASAAE